MTVVEEMTAISRAHLDLVYASALRQSKDPEAAADITQAVFVVFLEKQRAGKGSAERFMTGWLLKVTSYVVSEERRRRARRMRHEGRAAVAARETQIEHGQEEVLGALDGALLQLGAVDREVVTRRYLEGEAVATVAAAVGMTENTAGRRIARALEKLRQHLARRGVVAPAATVAGAMLSQSLLQTPEAAAASITVAAATGTPLAKATLIKLMIVKMQAAILAGVGIAVAVALAAVAIHGKEKAATVSGAAATAPAGGEAGGGGLRNTFPGGGTVELVGISAATDPNTWWKGNGRPLGATLAGGDFGGLRDSRGEGRVVYQVALRITDYPRKTDAMYVTGLGTPRVSPWVKLQADQQDRTLFYGAMLLLPGQQTMSKLRVAAATQERQTLELNAAGETQPALPEGSDWYTLLGAPIRANNGPFERGGKTFLVINGEPWGDLELSAVAKGREGRKITGRETFVGTVININRFDRYSTGIFSAWVFDAPLAEITGYEVTCRALDEWTGFEHISLKAGERSDARALVDGPGSIVYDSQFRALFDAVGERMQEGDLAGAATACDRLLTQFRVRRERMRANKSAELYAVDAALPLLMKLDESLHKHDVEAAKAVLESSNGNGMRLLTAIQQMAFATADAGKP